MTVFQKVICDGCAADITYTTNSVGWRLALINECKPTHPNARIVTDMILYPATEHDCHFCGLGCLQAWLAGRTVRREAELHYHLWKRFAP